MDGEDTPVNLELKSEGYCFHHSSDSGFIKARKLIWLNLP